jgi:hypothetical protein
MPATRASQRLVKQFGPTKMIAMKMRQPVLEALKERSKEEKTSMSAIIHRALRKELELN